MTVPKVLGYAWRRCRSVFAGREKTVAEGWDDYAARFAARNGAHLGDEWNDPACIGLDVDGPDRVVPFLDEQVFAPFFGQCRVMLEIGPGGGRFTEILLPKCDSFIAADTSRHMLARLKERFRGCDKLTCLLLDGKGLREIPDRSVDAAFSYGVFVHLQHWDVFNYLRELNRVLVPGGKAIIQHANTFSELGWTTFLNHVRPSLNRHKLSWTFTLMTPEIMTQLTERAGLELVQCLTGVVKRDCITLIRAPLA